MYKKGLVAYFIILIIAIVSCVFNEDKNRHNNILFEILLNNGEKISFTKTQMIKDSNIILEFMGVKNIFLNKKLSNDHYYVIMYNSTRYYYYDVVPAYIFINKNSGNLIHSKFIPIVSPDKSLIATDSGNISDGGIINVYKIDNQNFKSIKNYHYGFKFEVIKINWKNNKELIYHYKKNDKNIRQGYLIIK